jgi:hypothetical protein
MQHHFDSQVILSEDSQHKSLYRWFLRETGEAAPKYQRDQIPWEWSVYFELSDMECTTSLSLEKQAKPDEPDHEDQVSERQTIRAKLVPYERDRYGLHASTRYSMFGTNRLITEFELAIYKAPQGKDESCSAWGSVSYTAEADLHDVTEQDCLSFYLNLRPERFQQLIDMLSRRSISRGLLKVGGVGGFYSEWSPAITTDAIKVLTSDQKTHQVEIWEGSTIVPPRLGQIDDFELDLTSHLSFTAPRAGGDNDPRLDAQNGAAQAPGQTPPSASVALAPRELAVLKSLRLAGWVVAGLLLLMLFK